MKIMQFENLYKTNFAVSDIEVIYQTNLWSSCSHTKGRAYNGFLLFDKGDAICRYLSKTETLSPETLVYLPRGSYHSITAAPKSLWFYRVNFKITDLEDGEEMIFSQYPCIFSKQTKHALYNIFEEMKKTTTSRKHLFRSISLFHDALDIISNLSTDDTVSKISPAISYIKSHYTEELYSEELASMCYISQGHLFKLFQSELGRAPIEYRNHLRLKKSEQFLREGSLSISEISRKIGFENSSYFSRLFKQRTGLSPLKYRNNAQLL